MIAPNGSGHETRQSEPREIVANWPIQDPAGSDLAYQRHKLETMAGAGTQNQYVWQSRNLVYDEVFIGRVGIEANFFIHDFRT